MIRYLAEQHYENSTTEHESRYIQHNIFCACHPVYETARWSMLHHMAGWLAVTFTVHSNKDFAGFTLALPLTN